MTEDEPPYIAFTPVPLLRKRRGGWSPERQREFIAALARCGSVSAAARQVGLSARSAYALLDKEGAESFAAAWDRAVVVGMDAIRANVIDRAMNGAWVPVIRRGRIVSMKFRYFDSLAIGVLSGRGKDSYEVQWERKRRREVRHYWRELDRKRDAERAAEAAARAALEEETARQLEAIALRREEMRKESVRIREL
jgi:hypothetical protein